MNLAFDDMSRLKIEPINGWPVLYWIAGLNSAAVVAYMPTQNLSEAVGVSEMIQMSVRCSVPLLYLAFVASSTRVVFPSTFSVWLVRNRRYIGLSYAASMAWQLFFIFWMWLGHWDYYTEKVYLLEDIINQVSGYSLLVAMTITSFLTVRRRMNRTHWRILHKVGIYFLWATVASTYYYELTYYGDIQTIDYIYFAAGILVYLVRVAAWFRTRPALVAA
jgi:sulfoxide reductase heme-binding subunit YedZ